jgi:hypothetical protein
VVEVKSIQWHFFQNHKKVRKSNPVWQKAH